MVKYYIKSKKQKERRIIISRPNSQKFTFKIRIMTFFH